MKKVVSVLSAVVVASLAIVAPQPASAAAVKCAATKVAGHAAPVMTKQEKVLSKLPNTLTLLTNCGTIVIKLDPKAPITLTQMAYLVKAKFFDQTLCHRLAVSGFYMLQCGDPTALGTSGPGFVYEDENLPKGAAITYPAGTVAMANSKPYNPVSNGSQFFLVYKDSPGLPAEYSIWGKITKGLDILNYIGSKGVSDPSGVGAPNVKVAIIKAIVR